MMTAVGALPVLALRGISPRSQTALLGFGAGVMLAATFFSLLAPALEIAGQTRSEAAAALLVVIGMLIGAFAVKAAHRLVPHEHFYLGREGATSESISRIWLFVLAITIHNFPEGLAVGVAWGGPDRANALGVATGIGLQNMPEGLAVAAALASEGYRRSYAFGVALLTGLVEPVGGLVGVSVVALAQSLLPWALAFAAGAMLFVISDEIIPETHRRGFQDVGTAGLMGGFVTMLFLDVTLG
jgi:ZIP family zinc transporter